MATLPDVTTTAITVAVSIASAYPLIRRQVSVAWRETAEGWKARAEELKQSVSDADSERMVLRERVAKLESRPDMTDVANVLRDHGNMSSPTLLFVLERFMASTPPSGAAGLLLGLGPGFAAEGVVFRW